MRDGADRASAPGLIGCWQRPHPVGPARIVRAGRFRGLGARFPPQLWGWLALVVMVGVVLAMLGAAALRASRRSPADLPASNPAPPLAAQIELREACANDLGRCRDHLGLTR
jgi:hypothetical protein